MMCPYTLWFLPPMGSNAMRKLYESVAFSANHDLQNTLAAIEAYFKLDPDTRILVECVDRDREQAEKLKITLETLSYRASIIRDPDGRVCILVE